MLKKKNSHECPKCLPNWLGSFGDLMSLLLCFFVLLLSMSSLDARKVQDVVGSLAGALSVLEGGSKTEINKDFQKQTTPNEQRNESENVVKKISEVIKDANQILKRTLSAEISIKESENGFIIRLPANLFFQSGSDEITDEDANLFLKRIALIIKKLPQDISINVMGHTDNILPSINSKIKDNWSLSTARAIAVAKSLIEYKLDPKRIIVSGRSMYEQIASNSTEEGRIKNRRVEIHFLSIDQNSKTNTKQSVLDVTNKAISE